MQQYYNQVMGLNRSTGIGSAYPASRPATPLGQADVNAGGQPGPNQSFQGAKTRALRGFCPLNSNR